MLLTQPLARLYAILCDGFGSSVYTLPASTFRRSVVPLDLMPDEPAFQGFDRCVYVATPDLALREGEQARNATSIYRVAAQVYTGYLWGPDQQAGAFYPPTLDASEIAFAKVNPSARALSDAWLQSRALREPTLYSAAGCDPPIFGVEQTSSTRVSLLPTGRAVAVTEYTIYLSIAQAGSY